MMKTPIEAVIWDMGGVLLHMGDETPRHRLSQEYHLPLDKIYWAIFDSPSAQAAAIGKITVHQHWQNIGQYLEIPQENLSEFLRQFWSTDDIDRPLVDFILALRPGYRTGLLSNAWDNLGDLIDNYWQIAGAFDDIVISADIGLAKPDQRIYQLALERLEVAPEAAVFIDDVQENVEAARQVGMHAIQFKTRRQVLFEVERILASNGGQIPDQGVRLLEDLAPQPVLPVLDAPELIRLQVGLEYRLGRENLFDPFSSSTEQAQVIVYQHAAGSLQFFQRDLPLAIREAIAQTDSQNAFHAPEKMFNTLSPVCDCQVGGPYNAYYFPHPPNEEEYPLVRQSDSRFEIIHDGKPVSWAWSVRENEHCAEVAVETLPGYRRQGFARQVTTAWGASVVKGGRLAFFSHRDTNLPSRKLARSLGLVHFATSVTFE